MYHTQTSAVYKILPKLVCIVAHTSRLIQTQTQKKPKSFASVGRKKIKIYGVENGFLSQSDCQEGASL